MNTNAFSSNNNKPHTITTNLSNPFLDLGLQTPVMAPSQSDEQVGPNKVNVDKILKKNSINLNENGLTRPTILNIPTMKFDKKAQNTKELDKLECCICLLPFKEGDVLRLLFCFHRYHRECIDPWLSKKSLCPNCNFNLRAIN